ncbi:clusterin-associated protein 1 homolog isoform X2 [Dermacentor andersoni]|uniref:clusterin-associated protein 1 homolog isoform X2 n=1 Tax=Dermacentor andersoni TaxID=34620 RepID=UPI002155D40C|nr:clusterin-associated protein 1-like isoform X2 [Dermacentor andersoni]
MSYRELRNFTEMTRALGYPRLISLENFRTPNFPLVAEILRWLISRYDPDIEVPPDIDTEQDRVVFIKSIAHTMATKAHLKLNTRKLYMADGYAVKELLKITALLYDAMRAKAGDEELSGGDQAVAVPYQNYDAASKFSDLKMTRQLASEITQQGAVLYDRLAKEAELKEIRSATLSKQLEITDIEKCLQDAIKAVVEQTSELQRRIESVASDEANLEAKIEKKKAELERNQKRLATLQAVRPAFMDEYERIEEELSQVYAAYIVKIRCLAYLEEQLEELEKAQKMEFAVREQRIKTATRESNHKLVSNQEYGDTLGLGATDSESQAAAGRLLFGSMAGGDKVLDSDSDLDLEGEDEGSDDGSSDDDLELDLEAMGGIKPPNRRSQSQFIDSDNDF